MTPTQEAKPMDIVERLRKPTVLTSVMEGIEFGYGQINPTTKELEAAAEIERLRAAIATTEAAALAQGRAEGMEEAAKVCQGSLDYHDGEAIKVSHDVRRWERHDYAAKWLQRTRDAIRSLVSIPAQQAKSGVVLDAEDSVRASPHATPAAEPAGSGWKLVPVEPTEAMVAAGRAAMADEKFVSHARVLWVYGDMLAAAPPPPHQDSGEPKS